MRVVHGGANGAEEFQTLWHGQLVRAAIFIERLALNKFECEVRRAVFGRATVEQTRNVRVIQASQNLALVAKVPKHFAILQAAPDELQSDELMKLAIGALGQIDRAHPALPQ